MKQYIIIAAAAALCLTACNKEGGIADNRTITVEASIGCLKPAKALPKCQHAHKGS